MYDNLDLMETESPLGASGVPVVDPPRPVRTTRGRPPKRELTGKLVYLRTHISYLSKDKLKISGTRTKQSVPVESPPSSLPVGTDCGRALKRDTSGN